MRQREPPLTRAVEVVVLATVVCGGVVRVDGVVFWGNVVGWFAGEQPLSECNPAGAALEVAAHYF